MATRTRTFISIFIAVTIVGASVWLTVWALMSPLAVQRFLVRLVVISLIIFVAILFARYFSLLWFGFLQLLEKTMRLGGEEGPLPPVSVIVPAYNEGIVLESAIDALLRIDYPTFEIIVVDDGSTDNTLSIARRWEGLHGSVEVRVFTKANGGKATALNTGIAQARYAFVLCIDADSAIAPDSLREAMPHFREESVGAVAGNVKVYNRDNWLTRLQALEYIEGLNMPRRAQGFIAAVNIVPGPVGLFRIEALQEVGGYDNDTFAEDADLTLKLITAGWKIVYEENAVAWTEAPSRVLDLVQQRYRWTRGILQAVRKRKKILVQPFPDFPLWLSGMQMAFEGIVWPLLNVYGHLFFALVALLYGMGELLLYWWILLTLLDLVAALVTVSMEEESLSLVPLAIVYRFFFILFLDVTKAFAAVEEAFSLGMEWGKLRRITYRAENGTSVS
jgi:cellulose synthase/poly-beta-1,6-N-acetylglucosamine synthase-like glycosyltransferase